MIVTAIERTPHRRGRVDVYIDGERRFDVGRDVARARGLRPGVPIDAAQVAAIVRLDLRRQAMQHAAAMLARRPHSEREIRRRLAQRRIEPALIDETVARLRAAHLIDDAEFARSWAASRDGTSPRGRRLIVRELRARGVDAGLAADATASLSDEDAAYRAAARRSRAMGSLDYQTFRARLASFLQRRGFGWEAARAAIDRCWRDLGGAPVEDDFAGFIE